MKTVLIVDDDRDVITYASSVLEDDGYAVMTAPDGKTALEMIKRKRPDLIILDVLMPKQSGIKLYRELRTNESSKGIPVIMLTGIARRTFLRSQAALGKVDGQTVPEPEAYFEKPIEAADLARAVNELLS